RREGRGDGGVEGWGRQLASLALSGPSARSRRATSGAPAYRAEQDVMRAATHLAYRFCAPRWSRSAGGPRFRIHFRREAVYAGRSDVLSTTNTDWVPSSSSM